MSNSRAIDATGQLRRRPDKTPTTRTLMISNTSDGISNFRTYYLTRRPTRIPCEPILADTSAGLTRVETFGVGDVGAEILARIRIIRVDYDREGHQNVGTCQAVVNYDTVYAGCRQRGCQIFRVDIGSVGGVSGARDHILSRLIQVNRIDGPIILNFDAA